MGRRAVPAARFVRAIGLVVALSCLVDAAWSAGAASARPDAPVLLDVPFLPQGPLLCGGASVAMVQRYWGERDVYAESFEHLVDGELGGITTADLVEAVRGSGWRAFPLRADRESVRFQLSRGRPLVALLHVSGNAFHYVVLTGWVGEHVIVHDPSVGPFRLRRFDDVWEDWQKSGFWTLLLLPPTSAETKAIDAESGDVVRAATSPRDRSVCESLVSRALDRENDLSDAAELLSAASELCPEEAIVFRELAAVRFRQERWSEAVSFADRAVELDRADEHAWSLLGASRFLTGDRDGALDAWNRAGGPILDVVSLGGLDRTRQEVVYRYLSLKPGRLLTAEVLRKARRRAEDLPTAGRARVSFEPVPGKRAKLTASLDERGLFEPFPFMILRSSVDALTDRETRTVIASPTGGGERLEAGVRWWDRRPAWWISLDAPGALGWPGVVSLKAQVDRQSYALSHGGGDAVQETRQAARLTFGDWLSSETKMELGVGMDVIRFRGEWIRVRGAVEHRFSDDRLSFRAGASRWFSAGAAAAFNELGATFAGRSTSRDARWALRARLDARAVSDEAPLALWPGAGTGRARPLLLRAYPLLSDGVVAGEAFGPRLLHGTVEAERVTWTAGVARVGVATFLDWAWIWREPGEPARALSSAGAGVRVHVLGRTLRLDGATKLRGGGFVLSAGWVETW